MLLSPVSIALGILLLVILPAGQFPETEVSLIPHADKIIHAAMFFAFEGSLIVQAIRLERKNSDFLAESVFLSAFYAILTENIQFFLAWGRTGSVHDFYADFGGILLAVLGYRLFQKKIISICEK